jgi:peptidoglycan/xylan/chitin deacetylase (PgdA/CDA1 family)
VKRIKRAGCALLAFAMALVLTAPLTVGRADADTAYFTAVNDTLYELSDATMPFWNNGYLYIPSTVFSASNLGVSYAYGASEKKAMLYRDQTALLFDLENGGVLTQNGVSYAFSAITRNGYVFFPADFVCVYFTLSYTILDTDYIPLVRVRNSSASLRDSAFISAADKYLASRYNKYIQSKQTASTGSGDTGSQTTTTDETNKNGVTVCLAFTVSDASSAEGILDRFSDYGMKAAFFFTADAAKNSDDLLRRVVSEGHTVGIAVDGTLSAQEAEKVIESANRLIRTDTGTATRMILLRGGSAARSELQAAGYCVFSADIDAETLGSTGGTRASAVMRKIAARRSYARVLMAGDDTTASALASMLPKLREDKYSVRAANEVNV